jgi:hypothetical protein
MAVSEAKARQLLDEVLENAQKSKDAEAELNALKQASDSAVKRLQQAVAELQALKS